MFKYFFFSPISECYNIRVMDFVVRGERTRPPLPRNPLNTLSLQAHTHTCVQ